MRAAALRLLLCASALAVAAAANYGKADDGGPICKDGVWTEVPVSQLEKNEVNPEVQCWRKPPCIRWSWLSREKCKRLVNDNDYPTYDPYLNTTAEMPTIRDVVHDFLVNKTIFFVGDSINGLVYQAALCELSRWGLDVFTHDATVPGGLDDTLEPGLRRRLRQYWRAIARFKNIDDATGGGLWMGGEPDKPEVVRETGTIVLPKGWHKWKRSDMAAMLSLADVVVVNYALHYHGPPGHPEQKLSSYEQEMVGLFAQLEAFGSQPGKAAVFRETGAQHFAGTGAYAGDDQAHPGKARGCHCAAMSPAVLRDNEVTRFNDVVHRLAAAHPHVGVLPFYDLTAPRHDLHEAAYCAFEQLRGDPASEGFCCDCTHFCHTPQLWRHVFAGLYDVLAGSRLRDTAASNFEEE